MPLYCDHADSYLPHLEPHGWWRVDPDRPKRCDACGEPATEVVPDGTKSGLPMCADCAERDQERGGDDMTWSDFSKEAESLAKLAAQWEDAGCGPMWQGIVRDQLRKLVEMTGAKVSVNGKEIA